MEKRNVIRYKLRIFRRIFQNILRITSLGRLLDDGKGQKQNSASSVEILYLFYCTPSTEIKYELS